MDNCLTKQHDFKIKISLRNNGYVDKTLNALNNKVKMLLILYFV